MKSDRKLSPKDVSRAAWRWMFFHHCAQNYERMMGIAFGHSLSGALEKLYEGDPQGLAEALQRNTSFFNTEPQVGAVIPGITLALEEEYARHPEDFDKNLISSTKTALMGPLAGIGDSLLIGTLNPILLSIGIGLSAQGSPLGVIFFMISWLAIVLPMKYFFFTRGYRLGLGAVKLLSNEERKRSVTTLLTMVGLLIIGGVAASTVKAPVLLSFQSGEMTIRLQEILDRIFPTLLPLSLTLLSYRLLKKRGWSANRLLLFLFLFAAVMVALQVM